MHAEGAVHVTGVDTSLPAVELARENVVLNNLDPEKNNILRECNGIYEGKKDLQSASGMYRNLNSLAMQLTKKGGLLMTCSCSGAMTQSGTFLRTLQGAASMAGKKITVIRQAGAACDHPIDPSYPEGTYLSNILLRVL
ncbi:hypothetical protein LWI28_003244 [Acer negundo]|uniref:Uncharacterized protein n=1 Tax=Acer negundo TaxID=4023 RepID=A0AAD5IBY0_ACENE|nr:hypothetical protein LWI28_003244 [Acer negundo]